MGGRSRRGRLDSIFASRSGLYRKGWGGVGVRGCWGGGGGGGDGGGG